MDQQAKSSFIPKKPVNKLIRPKRVQKTSKGLAILGWVVFIIAIGLSGYVFYYHNQTARRVSRLLDTIESRQAELRSERIDEIIAFDQKLEVFKDMVNRHVAFSNFLTYLEDQTLRSVGFTGFELEGNPGSSYNITISAAAYDYASFALQSEIFRENPNLSNFIYSEIGISEEEGSSDALFTTTMTVNRAMLQYEVEEPEELEDELEEEITEEEI